MKIIEGKSYNKLTAIRKTSRRYTDGCILWECKCQCGKTTCLPSSLIQRYKSCGCERYTCRTIKPGMKFGLLTAVERVEKINRLGRFYKFVCDCGNEKIANVSNVASGVTKSCGCLLKQSRSQSGKSHRKGFGESTMNFLYHNTKVNAKNRKKEFSLSLNDFTTVSTQPCFYCKEPPHKFELKRYFGCVYVNGLDRLDSSKGYTIKNIVPCCHSCNCAKGEKDTTQFKLWIEKVYNNYVNL